VLMNLSENDPEAQRLVGIGSRSQALPSRATTGLMHCSKLRTRIATPYSISSLARSRKASGIVRPSALAVVRLMTRSNLVGCWTGISPGFAPR
jgi:hypothetical protein